MTRDDSLAKIGSIGQSETRPLMGNQETLRESDNNFNKMPSEKIELRESEPGSVTLWLDQLRESGRDERLQQEICTRYFQKLAAVAHKHLTPRVRRVIDEQDIALSALNSFFAKFEDGRFPNLSDRNQLWTLLTTIATYKAINARTQQSTKKRGGGQVRGDSAFVTDSWHEFASRDPGPDELVEFKELISHLLGNLDPVLREIAREKLLGKSDAQIAETLDVSPRTIHRKLTRIRTAWQTELAQLGKS